MDVNSAPYCKQAFLEWVSIIHSHQQCEHHTLTTEEARTTNWLKPGSPRRKAVQEVIFNKRFLKDLEKKTEFHHTGQLEVFHSLMLKYLPKRQHFSYQGMIARTQLAAMDHNFNLDRSQAVTCGEDQSLEGYKVVFPKSRKDWVAKRTMESK